MENFIPAPQAWKAFCTTNPHLGFSGSRGSFIWFHRQFSEKLIAAGVMRRTVSRRYFVDRDLFPKAAFDALTAEASAAGMCK